MKIKGCSDIDSICILEHSMKEKIDHKIVFVVQRTLFREFKKACEENYTTMSHIFRSEMLRYIKEHQYAKSRESN
jgi:hypothetical protein